MPNTNPSVTVTPTPYSLPTPNVHTATDMTENTLIDLHNSNISFLDVKNASSNFFVKFDRDNFAAFNTKFFVAQISTTVQSTVTFQYLFAGEIVATKVVTLAPEKVTTISIAAVVAADQSVSLVVINQAETPKPVAIVNDAGVLVVNGTYINSILNYNGSPITFANIGPTSGWLASIPLANQAGVNFTLPQAYLNDTYDLFIWMSLEPLGGYSNTPQENVIATLRFSHAAGSSTVTSIFNRHIEGQLIDENIAIGSQISVANYANNQLYYNFNYGPPQNLNNGVYLHMLMVGDNIQSLPFTVSSPPLDL